MFFARWKRGIPLEDSFVVNWLWQKYLVVESSAGAYIALGRTKSVKVELEISEEMCRWVIFFFMYPKNAKEKEILVIEDLVFTKFSVENISSEIWRDFNEL